MKNNFEINIAHLYPELLDVYGDFANIAALQKRLEWRNIKVNTDKILINDKIDYNKYDIYFIGGGQDKQIQEISRLLLEHKDKFKELANNGIPMLTVCTGYQLFGNYIEDEHGNKTEGLSIFDAYTKLSTVRAIGNVTIETDFLTPNTLVGFENHCAMTYLGKNTKPLGKIKIGHGNNSENSTEGAIYNNVIGTYLHGGFLPKNPALTDYILEKAIRNKINDNSYIIPTLDDILENIAHDEATNKSY